MSMRRLTRLTNAFSKSGKPVGRLLPALRLLQLLPDSQDVARNACHGIWINRSYLGNIGASGVD